MLILEHIYDKNIKLYRTLSQQNQPSCSVKAGELFHFEQSPNQPLLSENLYTNTPPLWRPLKLIEEDMITFKLAKHKKHPDAH